MYIYVSIRLSVCLNMRMNVSFSLLSVNVHVCRFYQSVRIFKLFLSVSASVFMCGFVGVRGSGLGLHCLLKTHFAVTRVK